jgi:DNA-binding transcriptional LysR family regulator
MHIAKLDNLDWEDLHVFLAVARNGSARKAGAALNCHYTSVTRRISALEKRLDVRLFDKSPKGYVLTDLGHEIVDHADNMESEALAISRRLYGADTRLSGELRVAMTTTIASYLLVDTLRDFADAHPGIDLNVVTDSSFVDLSRGEAHVTVRVSDNPGDYLVGRRYGTYYEAVYATPDYLKEHPIACADTDARWLHWLKGDDFDAYIAKSEFPYVRKKQTINDEVLLLNATSAGTGIATLPCFYGDTDPNLVRVGASPPEKCLGIWLLAHPDLVRNQRVRTFLDFVGMALEGKKRLLEGR